jgi:hypothetical protein
MAHETEDGGIINSVNRWCGAEDYAHGVKSVNLNLLKPSGSFTYCQA